MRILCILENPQTVDVARKALADFAEPDSIFFAHGFQDVSDYIDNRIVGEQRPLDIIITQNKVKDGIALDLKTKLINDVQRVYSNYDFNLDQLPVILLINPVENINFYEKQGFSSVLRYFGEDKLSDLIAVFQSELRAWRRKVVSELDNLGIRYNSGTIDYDYYFSKVKKFVYTTILSENFQRFPRKLDYYWLHQNKREIELAIAEFTKLLTVTHFANKKKEEKLYHRFFNKNPAFLLRDAYSQSWYEQRLYYNKSNYHEPDYSLKPNMDYRTELNILEVKLPNEAFVKKTDFHPNLYARVYHHLGQINDYKDYLENKEFNKVIQEKYGWRPDKVSYNLLMGRQKDKDDNIEIIERRFRQANQRHIHLMTYDELLEYQVHYLERVEMLKIL